MLVRWMMITLVGAGCFLVVATPWIVVYEAWNERRSCAEINPIATMVCALLCVFEVATAIDWLVGWS